MPDGSLTFDTKVDEASFSKSMDSLTAAVKEGLDTISAKLDALATLIDTKFTTAMGSVKSEVSETMESVENSVSGGISKAGSATAKSMEDVASEVSDGLDTVSADVNQRSLAVASAVGTMLGNMAGNLITSALGNAKQYIMDSIAVASDLAEVQNVVNTTFGENTGAIDKWAKAAKEAYGMSELKAKRFTSTMGAMLKSMKLSGDQVLDMSEGIAGLAGDWASFYNLSHDEAFDKLKSAMAGETEGVKALGINMSVANLEAFALSQGITKTYSSMSQAEQATLRYNFLMEATADAQGDFARTSDGYANQQRILDTTMEELSATVGSLFLPAATAAVGILNTLATGAKGVVTAIAGIFTPPAQDALTVAVASGKAAFNDFEQAVKDSDTTFANNKAEIQARYDLATQYLNALTALEQKEVKTDQDVEAMKAATAALVNLYPDLKANLDPVTGLFANGSAAIRGFITSLNELAVYDLYESKMKANAALIAQAYDSLVTANATLAEAVAARSAKEAEYNAIATAQTALVQMNADAIDASTSAFLLGIDGFTQYFNVLEDGTVALKEGVDAEQAYRLAYEALDGPARAAYEAMFTASDAADQASVSVTGYTQDIETLTAQQAELQQQQEAVKTAMASTTPTAQSAGDSITGLGDKTADAADNVAFAGGTIADAMLKIDDAQSKASEASTEQQAAIDKNAELSELTASIAANIETASKAGTDAVAALTAAKLTIAADAKAAITSMESLTTDLGLYVLAMKDTLVLIISDAETEAATAGEKFAKGASDGYKKQPYLRNAVNATMNQSLAAMRSYFNAFENVGYGIIDHVADGVYSGQGTLTAAIRSVIAAAVAAATNAGTGGTSAAMGINGSHANGLARVPFDGYIAQLHENEAVLPPPEAAAWRAIASGEGMPGFDAAGVIQAIRESSGGPIYVSLTIDGEDLSEIIEPKISTLQGQRLRLKGR
jgi:hypothetical protein